MHIEFRPRIFRHLNSRLLRILKNIKVIRIEYPSVPHRPPQFNTSFPHKDHTFSAPKTSQFNTKIHQFHSKNPLSFTPKTPQFRPALSSTQKTPQFNTVFVWGTEGSLVWNWRFFGVRLRDSGGWKGVALLCGTDVLNWGEPIRTLYF